VQEKICIDVDNKVIARLWYKPPSSSLFTSVN